MIADAFEASVGRLGLADASLFGVMAASGAFAAVGVAIAAWWASLPFILAAYAAWRGILVRGVGREAREIEALGKGDDPTLAISYLTHAYQTNARAFGVKERTIRFSGWLVVGGFIFVALVTVVLAMKKGLC